MGALSPARAALALTLSGLFSFVAEAAAAEQAVPEDRRAATDWRGHARDAAARFGLPEAWVLAVIAAESGGRTHLGGRPITSSAGAMGLMQIMPGTWAALRAQYGLGPDPHAPRDNIIGGTAYLRAMYDRFGYPGLFAAYNAGPGRYAEHVRTGRPLPRETRDYVAKIIGTRMAGTALPRAALPVHAVDTAPALQAIFFQIGQAAAGAEDAASSASADVQEPQQDGRRRALEAGGGIFVIREGRRGDER